MSAQIGALLKEAVAGSQVALAQALSLIENKGPQLLKNKLLLEPPQQAFRVGITGPPGAGKSTLVGQLLNELLRLDLRIAVLAVDPSSPFSNGAILGDRLRYNELANSPNVFVRSLGTRGSLGGLSASAYLMLRAFDVVGFDLVLIETVGVGQTELEIMNVADTVTVVLVPESGDSIQAMKAGLLEIADTFVVNKADRPGADSLARELHYVSDEAKIFKSNALSGEGVKELAKHILSIGEAGEWQAARLSAERLQQEARALLRGEMEESLRKKADKIKKPGDLKKLFI